MLGYKNVLLLLLFSVILDWIGLNSALYSHLILLDFGTWDIHLQTSSVYAENPSTETWPRMNPKCCLSVVVHDAESVPLGLRVKLKLGSSGPTAFISCCFQMK